MHRTSAHRARSSRAQILICLASTCLLSAGAAPVAGATPRSRPATQRLAILQSAHRVYAEPRAGAPFLGELTARRPLTGEATTLPVLGTLRAPGATSWLRVRLPGRPNGSSGWIAQKGTRPARTAWRLRIDLARRTVSVFLEGRRAKVFAAVVGKSSTPTPTGTFFVEETVRMRAGEPGGPFALALSARSDALQEFEGGPGQIAIHGRDNLGGVLGQAESHGCVRVATASIAWLAARIGPGVPVTVVGG